MKTMKLVIIYKATDVLLNLCFWGRIRREMTETELLFNEDIRPF